MRILIPGMMAPNQGPGMMGVGPGGMMNQQNLGQNPMIMNQGPQAMIGPNGQPLLGPNGQPILGMGNAQPMAMLGPNGQPMLGPNGQPILGPNGQPMLGPNGQPMLANTQMGQFGAMQQPFGNMQQGS